MKASELRIKNLLQDVGGNIVEVITVYANGNYEVHSSVHQFTIIEKDDDLIIPIQLTEEWLLKFGLINGVFPDIEYFSVEGLNSMPESYGLYYENDWTAISIEYVHQLQNLYFALTNTELEIK